MGEEACEMIGEEYAKLRSQDFENAETAIELVQFAYFKKVLAKDKKKRRHDSDDEEEVEADENVEESAAPEPKRSKTDAVPTETGPVEINIVRLEQFKTALFGIFESTR